MSEQSIVAIIVALVAVFGGGGVWTYIAARREAPIKKQDADLAAAHTSQQMALAVAIESRETSSDLREDLKTVRSDLATERSERLAVSNRVTKLEARIREQDVTISRLRATVNAWREAWDDLTARWHEVRLQDEPPRRPEVPGDL